MQHGGVIGLKLDTKKTPHPRRVGWLNDKLFSRPSFYTDGKARMFEGLFCEIHQDLQDVMESFYARALLN